MTHQPTLSVGTLFEEVDDTGASHHYWILAIAQTLRYSAEGLAEYSQEVRLDGSLATAAAGTPPGKRITWDMLDVQPASSFAAVQG